MLDIRKHGHKSTKEYHARKNDMSDQETRLKELMGGLLFTIKEYSDKHEKPDEILFVLDRIVAAYRESFGIANDNSGNGAAN